MARRPIPELVEEVASTLVLADGSDPESIEPLVPLFQELSEALPPDTDGATREMVEGCHVFLGMLVAGESDQAADDLRCVEESFTQVQKNLLSTTKKAPEGETESKLILPDWVTETTFKNFLSAQKSGLEELEAEILAYEGGQEEAKDQLRRRIHTLKGEAGALGLYDLESVCHTVEDELSSATGEETKTDLLLQTKDWLERALVAYADRVPPEPPPAALAARLGKACSRPAAPPDQHTAEEKIQERWDEDTVELMGEFLSESADGLSKVDQILMDNEGAGLTPQTFDAIFRVFHTIKGVAGFLDIDQVSDVAHVTETLLDSGRKQTIEVTPGIVDLIYDSTSVLGELLNACREAVDSGQDVASVDAVDPLLLKLKDAIAKKPTPEEVLPEVRRDSLLGEVLVETGLAEPEQVEKALDVQKESGRRLGEELVATGSVKPKKVAQALRAQRQAQSASKIKETVKVDIERVDNLVEMIGELVIVESMVAASPQIVCLTSGTLRDYLGQLSKISRDLQRASMQLRMIPVRGVFQKMARMVRDLSKKSGKKITLLQSGQNTEMDRSMVEQVSDPLVHMIRNAVDHGIESPEVRQQHGKPDTGTVELSAYHEGGNIVIEVKDDGKGLDRNAILEKATNQGLIKAGDPLTENEIFNLIFAPGFSTAKEITQISGRGVGMDVVKKNVEAMRGRMVISSQVGQGSTFKIVMPLTLAIIDGMLVECGAERYIIPTHSIIESIRPTASMLCKYAAKTELVHIRGEIMPLVRLDALLGIANAEQVTTNALIVVIEGAHQKVGLLVDDVITQQQVVIKSLTENLNEDRYLAGATILSDGKVGLILNVDEIHRLVEQSKAKNALEQAREALSIEGGQNQPPEEAQPGIGGA